jgi:hypothetical protein
MANSEKNIKNSLSRCRNYNFFVIFRLPSTPDDHHAIAGGGPVFHRAHALRRLCHPPFKEPLTVAGGFPCAHANIHMFLRETTSDAGDPKTAHSGVRNAATRRERRLFF